MDIAFPADGVIDIIADSQRDVNLAVRLQSLDDSWEIERGAVHAGSTPALLPGQPGLEISGRIEQLRFDDWLAVQNTETEKRWSDTFREADLDIGALSIFGQIFHDVEVAARRAETQWRFSVDSENVAGTVRVPINVTGGEPVILEMERLRLEEQDSVESDPSDPRDIMAMEIAVDDFSMGTMNFGSLTTDVRKVPDGLVAGPINIESPSFSITADSAWQVDASNVQQQRSRLRFELLTGDVKAALLALGYDPLLEGEMGAARADITWPGPPGADFLDEASGEFAVRMEDGALLEVEPGGGRLLGVLSLGALPQRLSLDFSDVFDDGLAFTALQG